MALTANEIVTLDRSHVWHPYAPFVNAPPVFPVQSASGVRLRLWFRPFGRLVYVMPPYIINDTDLATLCAAIYAVVASGIVAAT